MAEDSRYLSTVEWDEFNRKWWETTILDDSGEYIWDEEVRTVNEMGARIDALPEWAIRLRDVMPKYGFEICSHRWLDGLEMILKAMGNETEPINRPGGCGEKPDRVIAGAELRAMATEGWLSGRSSSHPICAVVFDWLGDPTDEKREAAKCFLEMTRGFFLNYPRRSDEERKALSARWRARSDGNPILRRMFEGEGFDNLLECACGFKILDRIDTYLRMIGGDLNGSEERHGICNSQLRFVFRDDPARYETTCGYLWGLDAYLRGNDEAWLLENAPEVAGSAIVALHAVSRANTADPIRRWLAASMLKSTKIWCELTLRHAKPDKIPDYARQLPNLLGA